LVEIQLGLLVSLATAAAADTFLIMSAHWQ